MSINQVVLWCFSPSCDFLKLRFLSYIVGLITMKKYYVNNKQCMVLMIMIVIMKVRSNSLSSLFFFSKALVIFVPVGGTN